MKTIADFAVKPQLIKITLDDQDIIENYGEEITFYMYDHLDINTYFNFYKYQAQEDKDDLIRIMKKIILKEDASPALQIDEDLPLDLTLAALTRIGEQLGKSKTKLSKEPAGTPSE